MLRYIRKVISVGVKKLPNYKKLPLPEYAKHGDAGMDLYAAPTQADFIVIPVGESRIVPCGISLDIPDGYEIQIRSRSGLAVKNCVAVLNSPGTIDSGYQGEICVILINHGKNEFIVQHGMRIAQMVLAPVTTMVLHEIEEHTKETARGAGGFGSTGV